MSRFQFLSSAGCTYVLGTADDEDEYDEDSEDDEAVEEQDDSCPGDQNLKTDTLHLSEEIEQNRRHCLVSDGSTVVSNDSTDVVVTEANEPIENRQHFFVSEVDSKGNDTDTNEVSVDEQFGLEKVERSRSQISVCGEGLTEIRAEVNDSDVFIEADEHIEQGTGQSCCENFVSERTVGSQQAIDNNLLLIETSGRIEHGGIRHSQQVKSKSQLTASGGNVKLEIEENGTDVVVAEANKQFGHKEIEQNGGPSSVFEETTEVAEVNTTDVSAEISVDTVQETEQSSSNSSVSVKVTEGQEKVVDNVVTAERTQVEQNRNCGSASGVPTCRSVPLEPHKFNDPEICTYVASGRNESLRNCEDIGCPENSTDDTDPQISAHSAEIIEPAPNANAQNGADIDSSQLLVHIASPITARDNDAMQDSWKGACDKLKQKDNTSDSSCVHKTIPVEDLDVHDHSGSVWKHNGSHDHDNESTPNSMFADARLCVARQEAKQIDYKKPVLLSDIARIHIPRSSTKLGLDVKDPRVRPCPEFSKSEPKSKNINQSSDRHVSKGNVAGSKKNEARATKNKTTEKLKDPRKLCTVYCDPHKKSRSAKPKLPSDSKLAKDMVDIGDSVSKSVQKVSEKRQLGADLKFHVSDTCEKENSISSRKDDRRLSKPRPSDKSKNVSKKSTSVEKHTKSSGNMAKGSQVPEDKKNLLLGKRKMSPVIASEVRGTSPSIVRKRKVTADVTGDHAITERKKSKTSEGILKSRKQKLQPVIKSDRKCSQSVSDPMKQTQCKNTNFSSPSEKRIKMSCVTFEKVEHVHRDKAPSTVKVTGEGNKRNIRMCTKDKYGEISICSSCLSAYSQSNELRSKLNSLSYIDKTNSEICLQCSRPLASKQFVCPKCHSVFRNVVTFCAHTDNASGSQKEAQKFKCHCGLKFSSRFHYYEHIAFSPCSRICGHCEILFKSKQEKATHICPCSDTSQESECRIPSSDPDQVSEFQCYICKEITSNARDLEHHMSQHKVQRGFSCPQCGASFFLRQSLLDHCNLHDQEHVHKSIDPVNPDESAKKKPSLASSLHCYRCFETFLDLPSLKCHINLRNSDGGCKVTKKPEVNSGQVYSWTKKEKTKDSLKSPSSAETITSGEIIEQKLRENCTQESTHTHRSVPPDLRVKAHSPKNSNKSSVNERPLRCGKCKFQCVSFQELERHLHISHGHRKGLLCEKCGSSFILGGSLREHMAFVHRGNSDTQIKIVHSRKKVASGHLESRQPALDLGSNPRGLSQEQIKIDTVSSPGMSPREKIVEHKNGMHKPFVSSEMSAKNGKAEPPSSRHSTPWKEDNNTVEICSAMMQSDVCDLKDCSVKENKSHSGGRSIMQKPLIDSKILEQSGKVDSSGQYSALKHVKTNIQPAAENNDKFDVMKCRVRDVQKQFNGSKFSVQDRKVETTIGPSPLKRGDKKKADVCVTVKDDKSYVKGIAVVKDTAIPSEKKGFLTSSVDSILSEQNRTVQLSGGHCNVKDAAGDKCDNSNGGLLKCKSFMLSNFSEQNKETDSTSEFSAQKEEKKKTEIFVSRQGDRFDINGGVGKNCTSHKSKGRGLIKLEPVATSTASVQKKKQSIRSPLISKKEMKCVTDVNDDKSVLKETVVKDSSNTSLEEKLHKSFISKQNKSVMSSGEDLNPKKEEKKKCENCDRPAVKIMESNLATVDSSSNLPGRDVLQPFSDSRMLKKDRKEESSEGNSTLMKEEKKTPEIPAAEIDSKCAEDTAVKDPCCNSRERNVQKLNIDSRFPEQNKSVKSNNMLSSSEKDERKQVEFSPTAEDNKSGREISVEEDSSSTSQRIDDLGLETVSDSESYFSETVEPSRREATRPVNKVKLGRSRSSRGRGHIFSRPHYSQKNKIPWASRPSIPRTDRSPVYSRPYAPNNESPFFSRPPYSPGDESPARPPYSRRDRSPVRLRPPYSPLDEGPVYAKPPYSHRDRSPVYSRPSYSPRDQSPVYSRPPYSPGDESPVYSRGSYSSRSFSPIDRGTCSSSRNGESRNDILSFISDPSKNYEKMAYWEKATLRSNQHRPNESDRFRQSYRRAHFAEPCTFSGFLPDSDTVDWHSLDPYIGRNHHESYQAFSNDR